MQIYRNGKTDDMESLLFRRAMCAKHVAEFHRIDKYI